MKKVSSTVHCKHSANTEKGTAAGSTEERRTAAGSTEEQRRLYEPRRADEEKRRLEEELAMRQRRAAAEEEDRRGEAETGEGRGGELKTIWAPESGSAEGQQFLGSGWAPRKW